MDKNRRLGKYDDLILIFGIVILVPLIAYLWAKYEDFLRVDYRVILFASPIILFSGFILLMFFSIRIFQSTSASNKWRPAVAEVERTLFAYTSNGSGLICYKYSVDGQAYTGRFSDDSFYDPLMFIPIIGPFFVNKGIRSMECRLAEKYPVGSSLKIYYDPDRPENSGLKKGWSLGRCTVIFVTILFALLFLYWTFKTALLCIPR